MANLDKRYKVGAIGRPTINSHSMYVSLFPVVNVARNAAPRLDSRGPSKITWYRSGGPVLPVRVRRLLAAVVLFYIEEIEVK